MAAGIKVSRDGAALHHRVKPPPWCAVSEIYSKTMLFVAKNQAMQFLVMLSANR